MVGNLKYQLSDSSWTGMAGCVYSQLIQKNILVPNTNLALSVDSRYRIIDMKIQLLYLHVNNTIIICIWAYNDLVHF